jgi:hypothetical protein
MHAPGAGVLVLSEFAGAAQSLGAGAILVNPWNITDMAAAIEDALTMSDQVPDQAPPVTCLSFLEQKPFRYDNEPCTSSVTAVCSWRPHSIHRAGGPVQHGA